MTWELVRFRELPTCSCGKVSFESEADARRLAQLKGWTVRGNFGPYQCSMKTWHLGHLERGATRRGMKRQGRRLYRPPR